MGELSCSALSTATAVSALSLVAKHAPDDHRQETCRQFTARGLQWLVQRQNADGGWGDTDKSLSNIATTMLVRAAIHLAGEAQPHVEPLERAEQYIESQGGLAGLRRRYGTDKTFAEPILTNCALAGLVPWSAVGAAAVRGGLPAVSHAAADASAGGELRRARAGGHRAGAVLSPRAAEPAGVARAAAGRAAEPQDAGAHAARQRRLSGGRRR